MRKVAEEIIARNLPPRAIFEYPDYGYRYPLVRVRMIAVGLGKRWNGESWEDRHEWHEEACPGSRQVPVDGFCSVCGRAGKLTRKGKIFTHKAETLT